MKINIKSIISSIFIVVLISFGMFSVLIGYSSNYSYEVKMIYIMLSILFFTQAILWSYQNEQAKYNTKK